MANKWVYTFKEGNMSPDKFNSKSRIRSRPVFNSTVALFGIRQVARMIATLVGKDTFREIFADIFNHMASGVYADLDAIGDAAEYEGKIDLIAVGMGEAPIAINQAIQYIDPDGKNRPVHSTSLIEE